MVVGKKTDHTRAPENTETAEAKAAVAKTTDVESAEATTEATKATEANMATTASAVTMPQASTERKSSFDELFPLQPAPDESLAPRDESAKPAAPTKSAASAVTKAAKVAKAKKAGAGAEAEVKAEGKAKAEADAEEAFDAKAFLRTVPHRPGCYRMYGAKDQVIYVGKAKDLFKRLTSYFTGHDHSLKTQALVSHIKHIEFTVTFSESEALLLENELIKKYQPHYNILLRDDKSYPYLHLTSDQEFAGIYSYRGVRRKGGEYFGPFPDSTAVKDSLRLLQKLFPIRQCLDGVFAHRSRPCLMAQMGKCLAPCMPMNAEQVAHYQEQVDLLRLFLQGHNQELLQSIVAKMEQHAERMEFEQAARLRDQLTALRRVQESNSIVANIDYPLDVIGWSFQQGQCCVHVLFIRQGRILGTRSFFPQHTRLAVATTPAQASATALEAAPAPAVAPAVASAAAPDPAPAAATAPVVSPTTATVTSPAAAIAATVSVAAPAPAAAAAHVTVPAAAPAADATAMAVASEADSLAAPVVLATAAITPDVATTSANAPASVSEAITPAATETPTSALAMSQSCKDGDSLQSSTGDSDHRQATVAVPRTGESITVEHITGTEEPLTGVHAVFAVQETEDALQSVETVASVAGENEANTGDVSPQVEVLLSFLSQFYLNQSHAGLLPDEVVIDLQGSMSTPATTPASASADIATEPKATEAMAGAETMATGEGHVTPAVDEVTAVDSDGTTDGGMTANSDSAMESHALPRPPELHVSHHRGGGVRRSAAIAVVSLDDDNAGEAGRALVLLPEDRDTKIAKAAQLVAEVKSKQQSTALAASASAAGAGAVNVVNDADAAVADNVSEPSAVGGAQTVATKAATAPAETAAPAEAAMATEVAGAEVAAESSEVGTDGAAHAVAVLQAALQKHLGKNIRFVCGARGSKKRFVQLAMTNAQVALQSHLSSAQTAEQRSRALEQLLGFSQGQLQRFECYDISHTMGELTVGSCVAFNREGPDSSRYRRYNITGITPGDDFAAMHQVLTRRFRDPESAELPDLILIDGGLGQLKQAEGVLAQAFAQQPDLMPQMVAVAKGEGRKEGLETLIKGWTHERINLELGDAALQLVLHIRDEAHRFAITGHRKRRAQARRTSTLEDIAGVGAKRRQALLQHLGGMQEVKRASIEELAKVPGISRELAQKIYEHLHGA